MKKCPKCKKTKQLSEFYQRKTYRWESERYQAYCKNCTLKRRNEWYYKKGGKEKVLARANEWRKNNPEEAKQKHKEWNAKSRKLVLDYYGAKCVCCGEEESCFLSIDHINNDGAKHRKEIKNKQTIYVWLRKNNYPTGFQILCYNCNMAKAFYGTCPHKK